MMPGETKRPFASTISAPAGIVGVRPADRGDLAVAQDDDAVLNRAARDGQHRAAANRDDAAALARAGVCCDAASAEQQCERDVVVESSTIGA